MAFPSADLEPGDRYLTREPCCARCCGACSNSHDTSIAPASPSSSGSVTTRGEYIAVKPYSYVFRAAVKGRWLGRELLELVSREFAFIPFDSAAIAETSQAALAPSPAVTKHQPCTGSVRSAVVPLLLQLQTSASLAAAPAPSSTTSVPAASGSATLDRRFTVPAYIEELVAGVLWLRGREAECRTVGRCYQQSLIAACVRHTCETVVEGLVGGGSCGGEAVLAVLAADAATAPSQLVVATPPTTKGEGDPQCDAWDRTVRWLAALPSEAALDALWPEVRLAAGRLAAAALATAQGMMPPPPLLALRQRDVVQHLVWRQEGRMFAHLPLDIIRCDVASAARAHQECATAWTPPASPALIVVNKPPGLPVHPSGCYRMNSVKNILEDVLGGQGGAQHYRIVEHRNPAAELDDGAEALSSSSSPQQQKQPYASFIHKVAGFELVRVWLQPSMSCSGSTNRDNSGIARATSPPQQFCTGVTMEDWAVLRRLFERGSVPPTSVQVAGKGTKRLRQGCDVISSVAQAPADSDGVAYSLKTFVVHRLDASTSGVLIFGLNADAARRTAAAIANKHPVNSEDDGGEKRAAETEDEEVEERHTDTTCAGEFAPLPSSCKVYYARVHGRADVKALALTQHHCTLQAASPLAQGATSADALVIDRPIGCLDHHRSLYWCPDATLTDDWMATRATTASVEAVHSAGDGVAAPARRNGKVSRTPEAVSAKRERMRQLTQGRRGLLAGARHIAAPSSSSVPPTTAKEVFVSHTSSTSDSAAEASLPSEAPSLPIPPLRSPPTSFCAERIQEYVEGLRSARTVLQATHYDVASDQTVVMCWLGTGRTHQLRVHLASLGHPIVWDAKYMAMEERMRHLASEARRVGAEGVQGGGARRDVPLHADAVIAAPPASAASPYDFYTAAALAPDDVVVGRNENRATTGCVCPEAIQLHAWRYALTYEGGRVESMEVPLPFWAR